MTAAPDTPALSPQVRTFTGRMRAATGPLPRAVIAAATGAAFVLIASVPGLGVDLRPGRWWWWLAVPSNGWLAGAMTLLALLPDRLRESRLVRLRRWLLWSTLPAFLLPWVVLAAWDVQRFTGQLTSGGLGAEVLFASWMPAFLFGVDLAMQLPERLERTLQRLRDRDVLRVSDGDFVAVTDHIEATARRWALIFGCAVAAIVLVTAQETWLVAAWWSRPDAGFVASQFVFEVAASYVAGRWLGRMAAYGRLVPLLARRKIEINVVPGHPDGAGGLKPIGTFYLRQSMIASLPAIMFAVWVAVFSLSTVYLSLGATYRSPYLAFLPPAILLDMLAFLLPLRSIHKVMTTQKEVILWRKADQLSRIITARQAWGDADSGATRQDGEPDLADLVDQYQMLEKAPTWPIDRTIRRRFTLHNLALMLPLVGYLAGHAEFLQKLSDVLK
jgi:hypothetical protein